MLRVCSDEKRTARHFEQLFFASYRLMKRRSKYCRKEIQTHDTSSLVIIILDHHHLPPDHASYISFLPSHSPLAITLQLVHVQFTSPTTIFLGIPGADDITIRIAARRDGRAIDRSGAVTEALDLILDAHVGISVGKTVRGAPLDSQARVGRHERAKDAILAQGAIIRRLRVTTHIVVLGTGVTGHIDRVRIIRRDVLSVVVQGNGVLTATDFRGVSRALHRTRRGGDGFGIGVQYTAGETLRGELQPEICQVLGLRGLGTLVDRHARRLREDGRQGAWGSDFIVTAQIRNVGG